MFDKRWILLEKLGKGTFGDVFKARDSSTNKEYAIKIEKQKFNYSKLLEFEYKLLKSLKGCKGIPKVYWYGSDNASNAMVMELLGPSIEKKLKLEERKFEINDVLHYAFETLDRIELFHTKSYIHRDIKPENFLHSNSIKDNTIFMIDFGLAKKFRDSHSKVHIPYRDNRCMTGTLRYASINAQLGLEQSRRDDVEGYAYMIAYLLRGNLPWQGLKKLNKNEKSVRILEEKMSLTSETLLKGFPRQFALILNYTHKLDFEEEPNYNYIRKLLSEVEFSLNYNQQINSIKNTQEVAKVKDEDLDNGSIDSFGQDITIPSEKNEINKVLEFGFIQNTNHWKNHKVFIKNFHSMLSNVNNVNHENHEINKITMSISL